MANVPAVSVVVPMFNAARYVAECLESLLAQTFADFEVIVVDDCSTDNSREIVESYLAKFGGRLKLSRMSKNSGSGAIPRNKGLQLSRGEYVFFVDADDLITPTALDELYTAAKTFNADVVYCERHYEAAADLSTIYAATAPHEDLVVRPTWESDNLAERVRDLIGEKFMLTTCSKFVRRELLIEHEIFFPHVKVSEDDIWTYALIFYAERLLRVPNIVYVWRMSENSALRKVRTPQETIATWLNPLIFGIKVIDNFMSRIDFFERNPQYRAAVLEFFTHTKTARIFGSSMKLQPPEIFAAVKDTFGKSLGKHDVLISWLLTDLITQQKIFVANQERIAELEARQQS